MIKGKKDVKLAWDIPKIWLDIEKHEEDLKTLKNINSNDKKSLVLLYRALNYKEHSIWKQEPIIKNKNDYINSFKWFLRKKGLFYPLSRVNTTSFKDIELILIHVFIPRTYADEFLSVIYKIYRNVKGNSFYIDEFNKANLEEYFKTLNLSIRNYIFHHNELILKLKNTIKEIFEIWNDEVEGYNFPDWFGKIVIDFKRRNFKKEKNKIKRELILIKNRRASLSSRLKNSKEDIIFLDFNEKKIEFLIDRENKEIILPRQPNYALIRKIIRSSLEENYNFDKFEGNPFNVYRLDNYPIDNEEIDGYKLFIYKEKLDKYIDIDGEKILYLEPKSEEGDIYYDKVKININRDEFIKLTLITPKEEVYNKNDLFKLNEFNDEGRYILQYSIHRSFGNLENKKNKEIFKDTKIFYIFKEKPELLSGLKIKYKGKIYSLGDTIKENFGYFDVKILHIKSITFNKDKNILRLEVENNNLTKEFYLRLDNKCGYFITSFSVKGKNIEINLEQYKKYLLFPLKVCLQIKNERNFTDCKFITAKNTNVCPSKKIKEIFISYSISQKYKRNIPKFRLKENLPNKIKLQPNTEKLLKGLLKISNNKEHLELLKMLEKFLNTYENYKNRKFFKILLYNDDINRLVDRYFYMED